jgi:hypothetical protein
MDCYYIHSIQFYTPKNNRQKELNEQLSSLEHVLIEDKNGIDMLRTELNQRCAALNEKYPKMRPLILLNESHYDNSHYFGIKVDGDNNNILQIFISKVRGKYMSY